MDSSQVREIRKQQIKTGFLVFTFFLMCILKLWFTMFVLFAFAVVMTLYQGRAGYCAYYCPMGTLQQSFYRKKRHYVIERKWMVRILFYTVTVLFWSGAVFISWYFHNRPLSLWFAMLQLMMGMLFIAIMSQNLFGKGFFCANLCPLRIPVLKNVIRLRRGPSER